MTFLFDVVAGRKKVTSERRNKVGSRRERESEMERERAREREIGKKRV